MDAEESLKDDAGKKRLSAKDRLEEARQKAEEEKLDGLCRPESIEIFETWYALGGTQHGLSPLDVMQMPAWLRQDFLYIQRIIGDERDKYKRKEKSKPPKPPNLAAT